MHFSFRSALFFLTYDFFDFMHQYILKNDRNDNLIEKMADV